MTNIYLLYAMDFVSGNCSSGPCRNSFSSKFGWGKLGWPPVLVPRCWRGKPLPFEHHIPYIWEFHSLTTNNKSEIFSNWTLWYHFELFPNSELVNRLCPYRWLVLFVFLQAGTGIAELIALEISKRVPFSVLSFREIIGTNDVSISWMLYIYRKKLLCRQIPHWMKWARTFGWLTQR